jgi:glycosyltransferase involved in cell wall biosynthesis
VIPSYSEGFCFAAAESIALGVPLISSGKGALQEVVSGKHLTMQNHDAEGLRRSLEKAYRGEWENMPVRKFHFRDTLEQYLSLYAEESTEKRRTKSKK